MMPSDVQLTGFHSAQTENTPIPTLTLDPFKEAPAASKSQPMMPEAVLTPEEAAMVDQFASQIDLNDTNAVLQYGAGAQKKVADFSDKALHSVQTLDLDEMGEMLTKMVVELKNFDAEPKSGFFDNLFHKAQTKIELFKSRYATAESNINKIVEALEKHQIRLLKDIDILDKMYDTNLAYFKELSMYILAGKQKLAIAKNEELPALVEKSKRSGLPEDLHAANDYANMIDRFEKKLHDLELTKTVAMQMAPQIRLLQNNDALMDEKIQTSLVNTIPLWKSQMLLSLGLAHASEAAKAQQAVTEMTNQLLLKNAEKLKMSTISIAKESERSIVDIETLKKTNQSLIETFDEVLRIQTEGKKHRQQAEGDLKQIENDLKEKLLQISQLS